MTNRSIFKSVMTEYLEETTKYLEVLREKDSNNKDSNYQAQFTLSKTGETRRFSMQTNPLKKNLMAIYLKSIKNI